jgi:hypothetical protein
MSEPTMVFEKAESLFEDRKLLGLRCEAHGFESNIIYTLKEKNLDFSVIQKPYKILSEGRTNSTLCSASGCPSQCPFYFQNWSPRRAEGTVCMLCYLKDRSEENVQAWIDFVRRLANA